MKNSNSILVVLLVIASFLIGSLWTKTQYLEKQKANPQITTAPQEPNKQVLGTKVNVGVGHLPFLGKKDAKVTIIEFADFQCPFCERLFKDAIANIKKDYVDTGKAKLYFRNYAFLGPESTWAAEASECANEQGKFWEFHNYLFNNQKGENQGAFSKENLKTFALNLSFDTEKFSNCLDSEKYKNNVENDLNDGKKAGVSGTPATFINGTLVSGAQPYSNFKTIIDEELKK